MSECAFAGVECHQHMRWLLLLDHAQEHCGKAIDGIRMQPGSVR
jgi:hypothetical protein